MRSCNPKIEENESACSASGGGSGGNWCMLRACSKKLSGKNMWGTLVSSNLNTKLQIHPVKHDLTKAKEIYLKGRIMLVDNGKQTDFWSDPWCGIVCL